MIKMVTNVGDIAKYLERVVKTIDECVIEEFTEWAKRDDEYLRANDGFINRTGNLRSSMGAAVIKNAEIAFVTSFATVGNGVAGSQAGKRAVEELASRLKGVIAKVMVAGMPYAQYVEDVESKDVLESRRIQCEREAEGVFQRAMQKAEQRIKQIRV